MARRGLTETLTYYLRFQGGQAVAKEFERLGDKAEKNFGKVEEGQKSIGAIASTVGTKLLAFGTLAATGLGQAARATQNLRLAQLNTNNVFGEAVSTIDRFATTSVEKFGLSERAYRQASAQLGSFITNLGFDLPDAANRTVELLEIATDLGAAFGRTTGEAVNAITAALRGERDTIEQFGVSIKQVDVNARVAALGLDVSTNAAKRNAEAVATLDLIYGQVGKFTGTFASEQNNLNREIQQARAEFEDLQASIGSAVLPILGDLAGVVGDIFGAFNDLPPELKSAVSQTLAYSTATLLASGAALKLFSSVKKLQSSELGLKALAGSFLKANVATLAFVGGAAILIDVLNNKNKRAKEAAERQEELSQAFRNAGDPAQLIIDKYRDMEDALTGTAEAAGELANSDLDPIAATLAGIFGEGTENANEYLELLNRFKGAAGSLGDEIQRLAGEGRLDFSTLFGMGSTGGSFVSDALADFENLSKVEQDFITLSGAMGLNSVQTATLANAFRILNDTQQDRLAINEEEARTALLLAENREALADGLVAETVAAKQAEGAIDPYTQALIELDPAIEAAYIDMGILADNTGATGEAAAGAKKPIEELVKPTDRFAAVLERANDAIDDVIAGLDEVTGRRASEISFEESLDDFLASLVETVEGVEVDVPFSIDYDEEAAREQNTALLDLVTEGVEPIKEQLAEGLILPDQAEEALRSYFDTLQERLGPQLRDSEALAFELGKIEGEYLLEFRGIDPALDSVIAMATLLAQLDAGVFNIDAVVSLAGLPTGPVSAGFVGNVGGVTAGGGLAGGSDYTGGVVIPGRARARGGPVAAGGLYLVGEQGPELFSPSSNGAITDANTTAALMSGSGGVTHVHVMIDGREIGYAVVDESQRTGGLPIKLAAS